MKSKPLSQEALAANTSNLASSILLCGTRVREAQVLAEKIVDLPDECWTKWTDKPPTAADGEIAGKDCLGYCHLATHLIGDIDGMWVVAWTKVPFGE